MITSRTYRLTRDLLRITAALPERIQLLSKKYGLYPSQVESLTEYDPTGGKYLEWIVRQFVTVMGSQRSVGLGGGNFYVFASSIRDLLKKFDLIRKKKTNREKFNIDPDINSYSYEGLADLVDRIDAGRDADRGVLDRGMRLVYREGVVEVFRVGGPGTDSEAAVRAACLLAQNVGLCTEDPDRVRDYLSRGSLYVVFYNGTFFAQFHTGLNFRGDSVVQFRRKFNQDVDFTDLRTVDVMKSVIKSGVLDPVTQRLWEERIRSIDLVKS